MAVKDEYYTIAEACKELGVTRQTIYRWIKLGTLTVEKIGRETLIEKEQVENHAMERANEAVEDYIERKIIAGIREKYGYSKGLPMKVTRREATNSNFYYNFEVNRSDGGKDMIRVQVGSPIELIHGGKLVMNIKKITRKRDNKKIEE